MDELWQPVCMELWPVLAASPTPRKRPHGGGSGGHTSYRALCKYRARCLRDPGLLIVTPRWPARYRLMFSMTDQMDGLNLFSGEGPMAYQVPPTHSLRQAGSPPPAFFLDGQAHDRHLCLPDSWRAPALLAGPCCAAAVWSWSSGMAQPPGWSYRLPTCMSRITCSLRQLVTSPLPVCLPFVAPQEHRTILRLGAPGAHVVTTPFSAASRDPGLHRFADVRQYFSRSHLPEYPASLCIRVVALDERSGREALLYESPKRTDRHVQVSSTPPTRSLPLAPHCPS